MLVDGSSARLQIQRLGRLPDHEPVPSNKGRKLRNQDRTEPEAGDPWPCRLGSSDAREHQWDPSAVWKEEDKDSV